MAMDRKLKAGWVKALRGGGYKQAREYLRARPKPGKKTYSYCCLGVLCRVAGYGFDSHNYPIDAKGNILQYQSGTLDKPLLEEFGLTYRQQNTLVQMNDGGDDVKGMSSNFKQIAAWIQKNIKVKKAKKRK